MTTINHLLRNVPYRERAQALLDGTRHARALHPELEHLFRSGIIDGAGETAMVELVASVGSFLADVPEREIKRWKR